MVLDIPESNKKRVVIVGAGFAGLTLARRLEGSAYQVILIDKNNYHQFQPLLYQVASSGLNPSSICFPLRKSAKRKDGFLFRLAEVFEVNAELKVIETNLGTLSYDFLVLALGTTTNFYGNRQIEEQALTMKSVEEALEIRNQLLTNFEKAISINEDKQDYLNVVVVGGGATGVEVAGVISELKRYVIPKYFKEIPLDLMKIYLIESSDRLLHALSEKSSENALQMLTQMGVEVMLNTRVMDYQGQTVVLSGNREIKSHNFIWVSGVIANMIKGLTKECLVRGNRLKCDSMNRVIGQEQIFVLGDQALISDSDYPNGHPQVAPAAIQQAEHLAKNLIRDVNGHAWLPFKYIDKGSMATIGKNRAVVDMNNVHFQGIFAWFVWMAVHLLSILGVRNKLIIFIDWVWNYISYSSSLRMILLAKRCPQKKREEINE